MEYIYNVYNFLNNTQGMIKDYQLKYLCELLEIDYEKVTSEDYKILNDLLESGEKEEQFYNYLINLK